MPANPLNSKTRVDQLGVEIVGQYSGTGHLRVDQLGVEVVGAYNVGRKLRVDQLGVEVCGQWASTSLARINQLGIEMVGTYKPLFNPNVTTSRVRVDQLGVEIVRKLVLPAPAGDTLGYEYYVGPGFSSGEVPKVRPSTFEPQWGAVQTLVAIAGQEGLEVNVIAGSISNVPLNGTSTVLVTFPQAFAQACYFVAAEYVTANGDSTPIYIKGLPSSENQQGFNLTGLVVVGTTTNTTGTFVYAAVGL